MSMDLFGDLPEPAGCQSVSQPESLVVSSTNGDQSKEVQKLKRKATADSTCDDTSPTGAKHRLTVNYALKGYVKELKGEREEMQDAHVVVDDYAAQFESLHPTVMALYGVFDGHGGARAACFASENLHVNLRTVFPKGGEVRQIEKEIKKCFIESYKRTDADYLKVAAKNKPAWKDGTTATVILCVNDTMYISNLGDSKAILCRYKEDAQQYIPVPLTTNHSPTVYEERIRIQKAGGHVKDGRVMGMLEISRSLGDGQYKNHGVTCLPDVRKCQLTENDRFVVIACDGLWKSFSPSECIQFVCDILEDDSIEGTKSRTFNDVRYEMACQRLVGEAVLRLTADNVTVLLVAISKFSDNLSSS